MTEAKLDTLAGRATVWLGPDDGSGTQWGSAFFLTPQWLLSCAHVLLKDRRPDDVGIVRFTGLEARGRARLAYWVGGGADPEQDLVLLRALDGFRSRYCVRLTDRIDKPHRVTVHGWYAPRKGAPPRAWSGRCQVNGTDGPYGLALGPEAEIPHGASGGPVLDRDRGVVVGVVKARRKAKDGGLAIGAPALRVFDAAIAADGGGGLGGEPYRDLVRAHDQWHAEQLDSGTSWVAAQDKVCGTRDGQWTPKDSATASALLADLPPPRSATELISVIGQVLDEEEPLWPGSVPPRDWRDGHGWLYESADGEDIAFLHYLTLVAQRHGWERPAQAKALHQWVRERARRLPASHRALLDRTRPVRPVRADGTDGEGPVVAVELRPDMYQPRDRFHWRIWTWRSGSAQPRPGRVCAGEDGVPLGRLAIELCGPLSETFAELDDGPWRARLEVVLPLEHFDIDIHLWRPGAARSSRPHPADRLFGVHRQVVLRCLRGLGESTEEWHTRWRTAVEEGLQALPLGRHRSGRAPLTEAPQGSVLVLCGTAVESTQPLQEAIGAGYPLALWSRDAQHTYGCSEDCEELRRQAAKLLRDTEVGALPEELRMLRERISQEDSQAYWADPVALMYDDPRRPVPQPSHRLNSP